MNEPRGNFGDSSPLTRSGTAPRFRSLPPSDKFDCIEATEDALHEAGKLLSESSASNAIFIEALAEISELMGTMAAEIEKVPEADARVRPRYVALTFKLREMIDKLHE